jgi:hypothetical protein
MIPANRECWLQEVDHVDPITIRFSTNVDRKRILERVLTGDLLDLLKLRAEQERERTLGRGPLLGRLMLIRQRAGVIA